MPHNQSTTFHHLFTSIQNSEAYPEIPGESLAQITTNAASVMTTTNGNISQVVSLDVQTTRLVLAVVTVVLIAVAIGGNAIVICAILRTPYLRRLNNYMIVSLSLADLGSATFCMPFFVMELVYNYHWPLPQILCGLYAGIEISFGLLSVFNLAAISCERVFLITMPMVYQRVVTETRLIVFIITLWAASFIYGLLQIFWFYTDEYLTWSRMNPSMCRYLPSQGFAIFAFILAFVLPLGIMSGAYLKIFCVVQGQMKRIRPKLSSNWEEAISEDVTTCRNAEKQFLSCRPSHVTNMKTEQSNPNLGVHVKHNEINDKIPKHGTDVNISIGHDALKVLVARQLGEEPTAADDHAETTTAADDHSGKSSGIEKEPPQINPVIYVRTSDDKHDTADRLDENFNQENSVGDRRGPTPSISSHDLSDEGLTGQKNVTEVEQSEQKSEDDPTEQTGVTATVTLYDSIVHKSCSDEQSVEIEVNDSEEPVSLDMSKLASPSPVHHNAGHESIKSDNSYTNRTSMSSSQLIGNSSCNCSGYNETDLQPTLPYKEDGQCSPSTTHSGFQNTSKLSLDCLETKSPQSIQSSVCSIEIKGGSLFERSPSSCELENFPRQKALYTSEIGESHSSINRKSDCQSNTKIHKITLCAEAEEVQGSHQINVEETTEKLTNKQAQTKEEVAYPINRDKKIHTEAKPLTNDNSADSKPDEYETVVDELAVIIVHNSDKSVSEGEDCATNEGKSIVLKEEGKLCSEGQHLSNEYGNLKLTLNKQCSSVEESLSVSGKLSNDDISSVGKCSLAGYPLSSCQTNISSNSLNNANANVPVKKESILKRANETPLLDRLQSVKQYPFKLQSVLKKKNSKLDENNSLNQKRNSVQFRLYDDVVLEAGSRGEHPVRTVLIDDEITGSSEDNTAETSLSGNATQQRQSIKEDETFATMASQRHTLQWAKRHFNIEDSAAEEENRRYGRLSSLTNSEGAISKSTSRIRRGLVENKAVKMTSYVIGAFVICWVPYQICMILRLFQPELVPDILWNVTTVVMFTSTAINPFIYNFYSSQFRTATKRLLLKCNTHTVTPDR